MLRNLTADKMARKVYLPGLAAAAVTVFIWILSLFGVPDPDPVVAAAIIVIVQFVLGYFVPEDAETYRSEINDRASKAVMDSWNVQQGTAPGERVVGSFPDSLDRSDAGPTSRG